MNIPHLIFDYCWVCNAPFTDAVPPGKEIRHHHHMVPRAFGGVDGPQVSLCDGHHNKLHKIAVAWKGSKPHFMLVQGEIPEVVKKLEYLASIVYNAELQTRNDPNKQAAVMIHLNARQKQMIDRLKTVYSKSSRPALLELALESLYRKHFTD